MINQPTLKSRLDRGGARRWGSIFIAAGVILCAAQTQAQQAGVPSLRPNGATWGRETAALPTNPDQGATITIPQPLSITDAERYRQIFELQRTGQLRRAELLIGWLGDHRLLGHVQAQRYLGNGYRSSYQELSAWLARYNDHPEAPRLYALAVSRRPAGATMPHKPAFDGSRTGTPDQSAIGTVPHWQDGITNWRRGNLGTAAWHFEKAAAASQGNDWDRAAAAYWAARAHLKNREPAKVSQWLGLAAQYSRTFYGQLAGRALGLDPNFDWSTLPLTESSVRAVARSSVGQRALALLQVGEIGFAEDEMQGLLRNAGPDLAAGLHAIAQVYQLPSLALGLGVAAELQPNRRADADLYPLPRWQPKGGFSLDRSLMFALVRQESAFDPRAQSGAGAAGLMQLMPETAKAVGGQVRDLHDPATNLALGQEYLRRLLADPQIDNNLFLMAIAYNAGPGSLAKWRAADPTGDPLLFIESLPNQETRSFVERVMANIWIYQQRLGQPTPSLDHVASGGWPLYQPQDGFASATTEASAGNGAN
ncbi:MAG: soluble lytic murein transglycosylase [Rhodospirillaceae bacterium]|nr:soluble lytic murein transglycosylase [Rhodospirillaceae bacterium]